jgi:hypothetical protein
VIKWWIEQKSPVQSNLSISLSSFDEKPSMYRLVLDYGGWRWAVNRTFGDIKTFYVNLCRHDKTTFFRLQHHFPIVGSRREGAAKHAQNYNARVAAFLANVAECLDPVLYHPLRGLIQFDQGLAPYFECVSVAQSAWRGYISRQYNQPLMLFVHERALVAGYDMDRKRYFHCWQLAVMCTKVLLGRDPRGMHQEVLKLAALGVPPSMFTDAVKQLHLNGDMGTLSYHFQAGWVFRQRLELGGASLSSGRHQGGLDSLTGSAMLDGNNNISLSGVDLIVANELLGEVVCEEVFFEVLRALSEPFPFDPMTDYGLYY